MTALNGTGGSQRTLMTNYGAGFSKGTVHAVVLLEFELKESFPFRRSAAKTSQVLGLTSGVSASMKTLVMAAAFAYGSHLVASGEMEFYNVYR